jgi:hypothetical protein
MNPITASRGRIDHQVQAHTLQVLDRVRVPCSDLPRVVVPIGANGIQQIRTSVRARRLENHVPERAVGRKRVFRQLLQHARRQLAETRRQPVVLHPEQFDGDHEPRAGKILLDVIARTKDRLEHVPLKRQISYPLERPATYSP